MAKKVTKKVALKDQVIAAKKAKGIKGGPTSTATPTGTVTFFVDGVTQTPSAVGTKQTRQSSIVQDL